MRNIFFIAGHFSVDFIDFMMECQEYKLQKGLFVNGKALLFYFNRFTLDDSSNLEVVFQEGSCR